jgi:hypothetical protein
LVFEPEETSKVISIALIDNHEWNPNREFLVELSDQGLVNAKLDPYLSHCRILVIDEDPFPSRKYSAHVLDDRLDLVPNCALVVEYLKMQWRNEVVRLATFKILLADIFDNIHFLAKAILQIYLVDSVLNVQAPESDLFLVQSRHQTLLLAAITIVIPPFVTHQLDLCKPFGVG